MGPFLGLGFLNPLFTVIIKISEEVKEWRSDGDEVQ